MYIHIFLAFLAAHPLLTPAPAFLSVPPLRILLSLSDNSCLSCARRYVYCAPECCLIVRGCRLRMFRYLIATNDCTPPEDLCGLAEDIGRAREIFRPDSRFGTGHSRLISSEEGTYFSQIRVARPRKMRDRRALRHCHRGERARLEGSRAERDIADRICLSSRTS